MAKRTFKAGATDQTVDVFIQDSSSTTGAGLSGLVYNSASLACYYRKGATGTATALTLATQTVGGAHSDGGFVEVQATNMKGIYRLDLSDTMVATAGWVTVYLYGATNMAPVAMELEIVAYDPFDTVRLGLTAIPSVVTGNAGAIITSGTGTAQLSVSGGTAKADVDTIKTNPVVNAGTVTFPTTATLASTTNITAGTITTVTNLTNAPTSGDLTATMKTSVTTACTASTPTAAAVTGAVGSVTAGVNVTQIGGSATPVTNLGIVYNTDFATNYSTTNDAWVTRISSGTGTGQLDFTSGVVKANVTQYDGVAGASTSGIPWVDVRTAVGVAWNSGAITASTIAANAIDAATFATDAHGMLGVITHGTAQAATSTTLQLASSTSYSNDTLIGATILDVSTGCRTTITDWDSASDTATVDAWVVTPSGSGAYVVFATPAAPASLTSGIAAAVWDLTTSGHDTNGTFGGQVSTDIDAILVDTAVIGAAGAGLTAIPWNASWDTEVQSECTDALNAYDPPTNTEMEARTIAAASYATATALDTVDNFLDTEIAALTTNLAALTTTVGVAGAGLTAVVPSAAVCNKIADHVRRRTQANVEASSDGDTLSVGSEYGLIQQAQESNTTANAGKLTVFKTDGTTELAQRTITTDDTAEPITGIS